MRDKDIAGIETAVGVTLPAYHRRFLLEHAKALRAAKKLSMFPTPTSDRVTGSAAHGAAGRTGRGSCRELVGTL